MTDKTNFDGMSREQLESALQKAEADVAQARVDVAQARAETAQIRAEFVALKETMLEEMKQFKADLDKPGVMKSAVQKSIYALSVGRDIVSEKVQKLRQQAKSAEKTGSFFSRMKSKFVSKPAVEQEQPSIESKRSWKPAVFAGVAGLSLLASTYLNTEWMDKFGFGDKEADLDNTQRLAATSTFDISGAAAELTESAGNYFFGDSATAQELAPTPAPTADVNQLVADEEAEKILEESVVSAEELAEVEAEEPAVEVAAAEAEAPAQEASEASGQEEHGAFLATALLGTADAERSVAESDSTFVDALTANQQPEQAGNKVDVQTFSENVNVDCDPSDPNYDNVVGDTALVQATAQNGGKRLPVGSLVIANDLKTGESRAILVAYKDDASIPTCAEECGDKDLAPLPLARPTAPAPVAEAPTTGQPLNIVPTQSHPYGPMELPEGRLFSCVFDPDENLSTDYQARKDPDLHHIYENIQDFLDDPDMVNIRFMGFDNEGYATFKASTRMSHTYGKDGKGNNVFRVVNCDLETKTEQAIGEVLQSSPLCHVAIASNLQRGGYNTVFAPLKFASNIAGCSGFIPNGNDPISNQLTPDPTKSTPVPGLGGITL